MVRRPRSRAELRKAFYNRAYIPVTTDIETVYVLGYYDGERGDIDIQSILNSTERKQLFSHGVTGDTFFGLASMLGKDICACRWVHDTVDGWLTSVLYCADGTKKAVDKKDAYLLSIGGSAEKYTLVKDRAWLQRCLSTNVATLPDIPHILPPNRPCLITELSNDVNGQVFYRSIFYDEISVDMAVERLEAYSRRELLNEDIAVAMNAIRYM